MTLGTPRFKSSFTAKAVITPCFSGSAKCRFISLSSLQSNCLRNSNSRSSYSTEVNAFLTILIDFFSDWRLLSFLFACQLEPVFHQIQRVAWNPFLLALRDCRAAVLQNAVLRAVFVLFLILVMVYMVFNKALQSEPIHFFMIETRIQASLPGRAVSDQNELPLAFRSMFSPTIV
jgi:hypothetical protein